MTKPELDFGDGHVPGRPSMVVRFNPRIGQRHLDELIWGLLPHDAADPATAPRPIHARAETVAEVPLFADAFRRRRAIVPVDAYYQRRTAASAGARYTISRTDGRPMAWAGRKPPPRGFPTGRPGAYAYQEASWLLPAKLSVKPLVEVG